MKGANAGYGTIPTQLQPNSRTFEQKAGVLRVRNPSAAEIAKLPYVRRCFAALATNRSCNHSVGAVASVVVFRGQIMGHKSEHDNE